jgi:peptide/nickel transport system substrate-binding protein
MQRSARRRARYCTGALFLAAPLALAACTSSGAGTVAAGSGSSSSSSSSAGGTGATVPTTATGTLTVGTSAAPTSLDPADGTSGYDYQYLYSLYARLLTFNPKTLAPEPGIATSWGFGGPGNLTFHLTLRSGLTFQDGTPLNADAVKQSLEHDLALKVDTSLTGDVKAINVTGTDSLNIVLTQPLADLPSILADRPGMITSPTAVKKYGTNFGNNPVGAGPYRLVQYIPGVKVVLGAWSGYKSAGEPAPRLQTLTFDIVTSPTALVNELTSGQIQYAYDVEATNLPALRADSSLVVNVEPSLSFAMLVPNTAKAPLNNTDVRLAIEYGIDRQALSDAVQGKGVGQPSWQPLPAGTAGFDPTAQNPWPYNPAKAKQLLAAAGYPHGLTINGITPNIAPFNQDATIIAAELAQIGIQVNWKEESIAQSEVDFSEKQTAPLFSVAWSGRPAAALTYEQVYASTSFYRPGGAKVPGLDQAIAAMDSAYTTAALSADIHKVNVLIDKYAPGFPLYTEPNITVYANTVHGDTPNAQGKNDLNYLYTS